MNDADRMADTLEAQPIDRAVDTVVAVMALGGRLAEAAIRVMADTGLPSSTVDPAAQASPSPDGALVAFVAHPAWLLAEAADAAQASTANQPGADLHAVRAGWITAARSLLTRVHDDPGACLLLAADEVSASAQGTVELIARTFGAAPTPHPSNPPLELPTVPEPAGLALARLAVSQDAQLRQLWEELLASSTPLTSSEAQFDAAPTFDDLVQALQADAQLRRSLRAARDQQERLAQQHRQLQNDQQLSQLQWQQAREELERTVDRVDALTAERNAALGKMSQTASALQAVEAMARQTSLERDRARADCEAAQETLAAQRAEARHTLQMLHSQLESQAAALQHALAEGSAASAQHAACEHALAHSHAERATLTQQLIDARQDQQSLLQQVDGLNRAIEQLQAQHGALIEQATAERARAAAQCEAAAQAAAIANAQRETAEQAAATANAQREAAVQAATAARERIQALELSAERLSAQLFAAVAGLESAACATTPGGDAVANLQVGSIELVSARDAAPHRELSFTFRDWTCPTGTLDATTVRLIEHQGHPGLVIFCAMDGRAPLTQWQPVGNEGGRPFMILLPNDRHPDAPLSRMASADWRLVNGLAALLAQELRQFDGESLHPHWRDIAARLHLAIGALPARLRYADLRTTPSEQGLEIDFDDVVQGTRSWNRLRLAWRQPRARDGRAPLVWHLPTGYAAAPLVAWPCREDGTLAPECDLPLGPGASAAASKAWLNALPAPDRDLLLAVFDALPAAAAQAGLPAAFADDVRALQHAARKAISGLRMRRIAQRMLGRIAGRA